MKKPYSVGYFSSYDRGLMTLLELWPEIKKQVPEATLDIYYGWNIYDKMHSSNPDAMKMKWQMIKTIRELDGVKENGRVNHETLAKEMKKIKVWAYPTEFTEIHCITALKAQEAGCIPVTTACYALEETVVNHKYSVPCKDIYSNNEKQAEFVENVVKALNDKTYKVKKVPGAYWEDVAKVWDGAMA